MKKKHAMKTCSECRKTKEEDEFYNRVKWQGENTNGVKSAWTTIDGVGNYSMQRSRNRKRVTYIKRRAKDSKLNTTTRKRTSIPCHPCEGSVAIRAISRDEELAKVLLEGWRRVWLALKPPSCCA